MRCNPKVLSQKINHEKNKYILTANFYRLLQSNPLSAPCAKIVM